MTDKMTNEVINEMTNEVKKIPHVLPAKYNKLAGFAYWLLGQMKDSLILSANGYDDTCEMMNLLSGDVALQMEFYEKFVTESTISGRLMKAEIKRYKAKPKYKNVKKVNNGKGKGKKIAK